MTQSHNLAATLAAMRSREELTVWRDNPANLFRELVAEWQIKTDAEAMRRIWETANEVVPVKEGQSAP